MNREEDEDYDDADAMAEIWRQDHAIAKSPAISPKQACKD
jgi:hypothetical protein